MTENTVFYTLSTLAQTCAALAALVGAVGLYRLQILTTKRRDLYDDMWAVQGRTPVSTREQVINSARTGTSRLGREKVEEYDRLKAPLQSSRNALIILEVWNLVVIGASLGGFNHVDFLRTWAGTFCTLWLVALGTVGITAYAVIAWTTE